MMKRLFLTAIGSCAILLASAQTYKVPVTETHEHMQKGQYEPTWASLETHQTPEWFRNAKFGTSPGRPSAQLRTSTKSRLKISSSFTMNWIYPRGRFS